jgi:hypothetical protein
MKKCDGQQRKLVNESTDENCQELAWAVIPMVAVAANGVAYLSLIEMDRKKMTALRWFWRCVRRRGLRAFRTLSRPCQTLRFTFNVDSSVKVDSPKSGCM